MAKMLGEILTDATDNILYTEPEDKLKWFSLNITTQGGLTKAIETAEYEKATYGAFDTETTSLFFDRKPFIFQFGFLSIDGRNNKPARGYMFSVDMEEYPELGWHTIEAWIRYILPTHKYLFGWNATFDLITLQNIGIDLSRIYAAVTVVEAMTLVRLAHDAVPVARGGAPLKLKEYCARFIDSNAKLHEHTIRREATKIAQNYNMKLRSGLRKIQESTSYTICETNGFDPIDLPPRSRKLWTAWRNSLPSSIAQAQTLTGLVASGELPYTLFNRSAVLGYSREDIRLTLLGGYQCLLEAERRGQQPIIEEETKLVPIHAAMAGVGLRLDTDKLQQSRGRLIDELVRIEEMLSDTIGEALKPTQTAKILEWCKSRSDFVTSTDKKSMGPHIGKLPEEVQTVLRLVWHYRTTLKGLKTYNANMIKEGARAYPSLNSAAAVTGRYSSNWQQMPREGFKTFEGDKVLFDARDCVIPDEGTMLVFIDESQMELRVAAVYQYLVGSKDYTMARAFCPMGCTDKDGVEYNPYNDKSRITDGTEWYTEDNKLWTPTDLHSATAHVLYPKAEETDPDWKKYRSTAKTINFLSQYRGGPRAVRGIFPYESEYRIKQMASAYTRTFPGMKAYYDYCDARAATAEYTENLFGRRYYNCSGRDLTSYLIQGTCAEYIKWKLIEIYNYMQENNMESRVSMSVHDEFLFNWSLQDDMKHLRAIVDIMEKWDDSPIPMVAEASFSTTTWKEKKEYVWEENYNASE